MTIWIENYGVWPNRSMSWGMVELAGGGVDMCWSIFGWGQYSLMQYQVALIGDLVKKIYNTYSVLDILVLITHISYKNQLFLNTLAQKAQNILV